MAAPPAVRLGALRRDSVAPNVLALVRLGAQARPALARELRGSVALRFAEDYAGVRIDFAGEEIVVGDDVERDDPPDLAVTGRMGDVSALVVAPLTRGLPRPTSAAGFAALMRLADGRVAVEGPLGLARRVLRLLQIDP